MPSSSAMNKVRLRVKKIDIADVLRTCAIAATIVTAITFFAGCVTERFDQNGQVMRKRQTDR
jgi:hypothetical protein